MSAIKTCIVHEGYTDTDCEFCETELEQMNQRYMRMMRDCEEQEKMIMSFGAQVNPQNWFNLRLDMITSIMFRDPKQRLAFESEFAKHMHEALTEMSSEAKRARLMNGVNPNMKVK